LKSTEPGAYNALIGRPEVRRLWPADLRSGSAHEPGTSPLQYVNFSHPDI